MVAGEEHGSMDEYVCVCVCVCLCAQLLTYIFEFTHLFSRAGQICRIGSGLYPEFAFHTCTTQLEDFCTDVFTTAKKSSAIIQARDGGKK